MRILQLAAGTDPRLNAREYQLRRLIDRILREIQEALDLGAPLDQVLKDLDDQVYRLTGQSLVELLEKNNTSTYHLGYQDADLLVARYRRIQQPGERPIRQDLIDRLTGHTVSFVRGIADDTKQQLARELREGYQLGESTPKLRDRVQQVMGTERVSATRLARTMTNETYNQAHMARYKESGVPGVQFVAAKGEKEACDVCRALDGHIWALNDPGIIRPSLHFNCRCRLVPWLRRLPGPRIIDSEVMSVYTEFRGKYFPVPLYA